MALRHLGSNKKAAFVSLVIEVINADRHVDINEFLLVNDINEREHIGSTTFALGKQYDLELALASLSRCTPDVKCEIAGWLIKVAEADGNVQAEERAVLHMIFDRLGILAQLPCDND